MSVGHYCNREVVISYSDESIQEAAKLMRQHHVGCLVIVEKDSEKNYSKPVGILTDRDIVVELIAEGVDLSSISVGDVFNRQLLTVSEDEPLTDVVDKMKAKGVRRVPVINESDGLVGILALDDLIELYAEQLSHIVDVINQEKNYEEKTR